MENIYVYFLPFKYLRTTTVLSFVYGATSEEPRHRRDCKAEFPKWQWQLGLSHTFRRVFEPLREHQNSQIHLKMKNQKIID